MLQMTSRNTVQKGHPRQGTTEITESREFPGRASVPPHGLTKDLSSTAEKYVKVQDDSYCSGTQFGSPKGGHNRQQKK